MKKKKYLAIFMAMSMATATAPVTALADGADTTGTESGTGAGESGSGETGSTGENGGTEGGSTGENGGTTAPEEEPATEVTFDENGVAKLEKDTVLSALEADKTYDLNGHNLTYTGQAVTVSQTLTFMDSTKSGESKLSFTGVKGTQSAINPIAGGTVNVKDIDVECSGSAFYPEGNAAALNITNSHVKAKVYCVGTNAGKDANYGVAITLKDSTFEATGDGDNCPVMINVEGTLNIDNCKIIGERQGVLVRAGAATISNSEITTKGTYANKEQYYNAAWKAGNEVPAAALTVGNYVNGEAGAYKADATVSLENTKVTGENEFPAIYVDANHKFKGEVTISGDSAVSGAIVEGQNKDADTNKKISISISGGVFDSNVQAYAADGYKAIQVTGDKYVVTNEIALDKKSTRIRRGYTDTLKAIVEANGKTYDVADSITWASDKETVATVENGVVTGVDYGTATITATLGTTTETPDTTEAPATQAEDDTATGGDTVTGGDNTPSNTLTASCTVDVYKKSSSSSSSGGGGGSSATKHGVTTSDSKNGAVTASAAKAETGDKVILTPKADEGYELDKITAKDKDGKEVKLKAEKDGTYSFTMPKGGVTVDTTFKQAEGATNTDKPAAATKTIILQIGSTAVLVDEQAIINDVAPVIHNDRTLVPIRVITEALGGQVAWNEAAKEVTLTVNGKEIKMTIGKVLEKYGVAPVIIGGRTFVPVRFVADELGAVTTWDDATKTVAIQAVK